MRKTGMTIALVALLVALFAAAAYAATISGGPGPNTLRDPTQNEIDYLYGLGGDDHVLGGAYTSDEDNLYGNGGHDYVDGVDQDTSDFVSGGAGSGDVCWRDRDLNATTDTSDDTSDTIGAGCERVRTASFNPAP